MEHDNGHVTPRGCVMVPAELVEALSEAALRAIREWHEENDFPLEPMVCAAAMSIAERMVCDLMSGSDDDETMQ